MPRWELSVIERDSQGRKLCRRCNRWLPESMFGLRSASADGLYGNCKQCVRMQSIYLMYGLDEDQYINMIVEQHNQCSICFRILERIAIDHDHSCCAATARSCGKCVRGLLCQSCNGGLGYFQDDPNRLRSAADYVERYVSGS